jgi:hypothetical protein
VSRERLTLDAIQWPRRSGTSIVLFVIHYGNNEECPTTIPRIWRPDPAASPVSRTWTRFGRSANRAR